MKKQIVAIMLLLILLLPMLGGIRRIRNLRRDTPPKTAKNDDE